MGPLLSDSAMMHDQDTIGSLDGRESVRHNQGGPLFGYSENGLLDEPFCFRIHARSRFIKDEDLRVIGKGPGEG
jgi:hypothetical protein